MTARLDTAIARMSEVILGKEHQLRLALAGLLLVMLFGVINYNNNLGHLFTFLVGSMALVSILHTYRNLAHLDFAAGRVAPVFAGERAGFELLVKQFGGDRADEIWLDWSRLPGLDPEPRLSLLCRWVLEAHRQQRSFGLWLPGREIAISAGTDQQRRCLEALARFE